ncbi:hypothetical protein RHGRI_032915 [Rhododendron griersonianum]|uniref:Protein NEOXANTHIN-DEFICIENT 1 n=1 Tax=Rhododendron griersonianum TaxID=479676 RepID=A0AAV6IH66_9ERIC|nr:hypothetical protein RHGRI_032915 [Rhododendron griersonianum]
MVADVIYHCRFPSLSLSLKNLRLITLCGRSSNNLNWDSPKDAIVFYSILLEDLVLWSALYQLHLVKSETVRAFIPKEFKLVEAFGYDDSPAGIFDELVVIAGIVWNPPTSCAWAARVLVNSDEACVHGRKVGSSLMDVGLPSQVARFSKYIEGAFTICVLIFNFTSLISALAKAVPELNSNKLIGPVIKMSLPSFSGRTEYNPHLLKYSCQIECRIRAV